MSIPNDSVQLYMRAADTAVLPFNEVLNSASALLALGFGLPVVAPAIGCIPEIVGSGPAAILYPPEGPDGLHDAMMRARTADPEAVASDARARATLRDWSDVARMTAAAYRGDASPARLQI